MEEKKNIVVDYYNTIADEYDNDRFNNSYGQFIDYEEHALQTDSDSLASAYVVIADDEDNRYWGVGVDSDITMASVYALITAINRENKVKQFIPTK